MNKHVIIYDTANAGIDWNADIVERCKADSDANIPSDTMLIGRSGFVISVNEPIAELLTRHALSLTVVDPDVDIAIYIGNYVYNGFKHGLFSAGSKIEVVTESTNVETAVTMATILAAEHIKPEDKFTVVVDRVVLQNGTKRIYYTKPNVILGADPDSERD